MSLLLYNWYPGSGVVLDCINSLSLPAFVLILQLVGGDKGWNKQPKYGNCSKVQTRFFSYFSNLWVIWSFDSPVSYQISKADPDQTTP